MTFLFVVIAVVAVACAGYFLKNGRSTTWLDGVRRTNPEQAARLEAQRAEQQMRTQNGGGFVGGGLGGF